MFPKPTKTNTTTSQMNISLLLRLLKLATLAHFGLFVAWTTLVFQKMSSGSLDSFDTDLGPIYPLAVSPFFNLLAMADHLWCLYYQDRYKEIIAAHGVVRVRWIEYSVSASLMNMQIAVVSGVTSGVLLLLVVGMTAITMFFGYRAEDLGRKPSDYNSVGGVHLKQNTTLKWFYFAIGCVPFSVAWVIILNAFASNTDPKPPPVVYGIVISLVILESLFACVQALDIYHQNRPVYQSSDVLSRETQYTTLSFVAKCVLSVLVSVGTSRPQR
jgi:bacteriorhodopsin